MIFESVKERDSGAPDNSWIWLPMVSPRAEKQSALAGVMELVDREEAFRWFWSLKRTFCALAQFDRVRPCLDIRSFQNLPASAHSAFVVI